MTERTGVPKDEFLASVRQALGKDRPPPVGAIRKPPVYPRLGETLAELEAAAQEVRQRTLTNRGALLDRLAATAQLQGWQVWRGPDPEEAIGYIGSVAAAWFDKLTTSGNRVTTSGHAPTASGDNLTASGVRRVVRSDQEVFRTVPVDAALRNLGLELIVVARDQAHSRDSLREAISTAGLGLTGADYAVAETGSVVVLPRQGLSRLVSVVPPVHLALVRPQDLVENLDDLFLLRRLDYHQNGGEMGSYLNFISGPSRTADIEQTLVIGVHGPREVHLVLLG